MKIEVVYATPTKQHIIPLEMPENSTLLEAIRNSHVLELCPEIDLQKQKVGIFSVIANVDTVLKENDRVEIYRPLSKDPITKRFEQVKKERKKQ